MTARRTAAARGVRRSRCHRRAAQRAWPPRGSDHRRDDRCEPGRDRERCRGELGRSERWPELSRQGRRPPRNTRWSRRSTLRYRSADSRPPGIPVPPMSRGLDSRRLDRRITSDVGVTDAFVRGRVIERPSRPDVAETSEVRHEAGSPPAVDSRLGRSLGRLRCRGNSGEHELGRPTVSGKTRENTSWLVTCPRPRTRSTRTGSSQPAARTAAPI